MNIFKTKKAEMSAKRIFMTKGACSNTFFYILNREFGHPKEHEERATDPLAGGILQNGYQCGMLWGASMALGAESLRRTNDMSRTIAKSIKATQHVMKSFKDRTKCIECEDFTKTDFKNKWSFAKYLFSGKFYSCFKLAEKWAPEAITAAHEGLAFEEDGLKYEALSCSTELIKKIGGTEEEMAMVSGFAGGLGLSGNGCGVLAAAIWMNILQLVRKGNWKSTLQDPDSNKVLERFYQQTDYKMECHEICGQRFTTIDEHSEFIRKGGCEKLIEILADSSE